VTCGTKIHHLERWNYPEADLVNARAMEFFKRALRSGTASVDLSWATVYRAGDYRRPTAICAPRPASPAVSTPTTIRGRVKASLHAIMNAGTLAAARSAARPMSDYRVTFGCRRWLSTA